MPKFDNLERITYGQTWEKCRWCGRTFNMLDQHDNQEWYDGHDCEDNPYDVTAERVIMRGTGHWTPLTEGN